MTSTLINVLPDLSNLNVVIIGEIESDYLQYLQNHSDKIHVTKDLQNEIKQNGYLCTNGYDAVLCFWKFNKLSNEELHKMIITLLGVSRRGGKLIFVETCYDTTERCDNLRNPGTLTDFLEIVCDQDESGSKGFEVQHIQPVQAAGQSKIHDLVWTANVVSRDHKQDKSFVTSQQFLNKVQYNRNGILRYEKIFGKHFISTGGKDTTETFLRELGLKASQKVLDVGAGIGGSAFLMAEQYGVEVLGIDLSSNMTSLAWERANELGDLNVRFEVCDALKQRYKPGTFDVIYGRDSAMHIADKKHLFKLYYDWLKPGGQVFLTDYCCKDGDCSDECKTYIQKRNYQFLSIDRYTQLLKEAGFHEVEGSDISDFLVESLNKELRHLKNIKTEFLKDHSLTDFYDLETGWNTKLGRVSDGDQRWGKFRAFKGK